MYINRGVHKKLKEWKAEAKNTHLCVYKGEKDNLIIYTDRPGYMIGRAGTLVEKYRKAIEAESFGTIKNILFVETYGIF